MSPWTRFLSVRRAAALAVMLLAAQAIAVGVTTAHGRGDSAAVAGGERPLMLAVGVVLLTLAPRVWRGARTSTALAVGGLVALAGLQALAARWAPAGVEGTLAGVLAAWSALRPSVDARGPTEDEWLAARAIVDAHGTDSLSPFLLRPDKRLAFAAGGVLAYRVIGSTAIVSADPVGPPGSAEAILRAFRSHARRMGWRVVIWGASARYLDVYRALGMFPVQAGEEAFVDPRSFTLEGRAVRKLRQSVQRARRRGWSIQTLLGREVDPALEAEIESVAARWRLEHPKILGFAMSMGPFASELRADDLVALARSPEGELRAVMRFARCGELLSLDTMQRVGETPNGLNEALVAAAIGAARELGVAEVSLNYAGLAHLLRGDRPRGRLARALSRAALLPLRRHFQMDRLVRFNDKFSPEWRPRYLVCESPAALPSAILRVLQVEGHLPVSPKARRAQLAAGARRRARPIARPAPPREPVGNPR